MVVNTEMDLRQVDYEDDSRDHVQWGGFHIRGVEPSDSTKLTAVNKTFL